MKSKILDTNAIMSIVGMLVIIVLSYGIDCWHFTGWPSIGRLSLHLLPLLALGWFKKTQCPSNQIVNWTFCISGLLLGLFISLDLIISLLAQHSGLEIWLLHSSTYPGYITLLCSSLIIAFLGVLEIGTFKSDGFNKLSKWDIWALLLSFIIMIPFVWHLIRADLQQIDWATWLELFHLSEDLFTRFLLPLVVLCWLSIITLIRFIQSKITNGFKWAYLFYSWQLFLIILLIPFGKFAWCFLIWLAWRISGILLFLSTSIASMISSIWNKRYLTNTFISLVNLGWFYIFYWFVLENVETFWD